MAKGKRKPKEVSKAEFVEALGESHANDVIPEVLTIEKIRSAVKQAEKFNEPAKPVEVVKPVDSGRM